MSEQRPNPSMLYRDPQHAVFFGVCAGIAEYFDWNRTALRVLAVVGALVFTVPTFILYMAAALLLKKKPRELYLNEDEATFWKGVRRSPRNTLTQIRHKFMDLENRLRRMEAYVTSTRYQLDRELKD